MDSNTKRSINWLLGVLVVAGALIAVLALSAHLANPPRHAPSDVSCDFTPGQGTHCVYTGEH